MAHLFNDNAERIYRITLVDGQDESIHAVSCVIDDHFVFLATKRNYHLFVPMNQIRKIAVEEKDNGTAEEA